MAGIAIDVIDKMRRPLPGHVQEGQPRTGVVTAIETDAPTAVAIYPAGPAAGTNSATRRQQPGPNTSIRIVGQCFTQAFGGE
jgi:hypothetical protein